MTSRPEDEPFDVEGAGGIEFASGVWLPLKPGLFEDFASQMQEFVIDPELRALLYERLVKRIVDDGKIPYLRVEVPYSPGGVQITSRGIAESLNLPLAGEADV